jgi:hypothetical protein
MSLRKVSFALVVGWLAMVGAVRAETASFPKENPVFTIDVPTDAEVKYEADGLRIRPAKHFGNITFSALPEKIHDDASARDWLARALSSYTMNYSGLEKPIAPEVPKERRRVGAEAHGFVVTGAAGNMVYIQSTNDYIQPTQYLEGVFTFDDKNYFSVHSEDNAQMETLLKADVLDFWRQRDRIIESIKRVK